MDLLGILFVNLDVSLLVLFGILLGAFIYWEYRRGEKLEVQQLIPYVLYMILYRTKWGIDRMDLWAKKYSSWLRLIMPIVIAIGLIGMVLMTVFMIVEFIRLFVAPSDIAPAQLVLPIESQFTFYVPFFYWIIAIFLIATVHEFAHGVVARYYGMRVKSTGFAFLGVVLPIIPAAFVEPDEKQIVKKKWEEQVAVYAAGPFINIVFGILAILLVSFAFAPLAQSVIASDAPSGIGIASFSNESGLRDAGIGEGEYLILLDGEPVYNATALLGFLEATEPYQNVRVTTNAGEYEVTLTEGLEDHGYLGFQPKRAVVGALAAHPWIVQNFVFAAASYNGLYPAPGPMPLWLAHIVIWTIGLMLFLFILNLGIGLFNLLPIFIADGARILFVTLKEVFSMSEGLATRITFMVGWVMLGALVALIFLPMTGILAMIAALG